MVKGWATHPGGRHHGAHAGLAARANGAPDGGFLDFSQNINPLGAPPAALAAAHEALDSEAGVYPDLDYPELREALARYLDAPADFILPTNGGVEALFLAARAAEAGGKALLLEPTFSEYEAAARAAGLEPVRRVSRKAGDGFRFDPGSLEDLEDVGLIFLCNPNNPTGGALHREEILALADRAREADAVLVVDEAFADFAPEVSVASEVGNHLCVARSFTKFFAIPGLRLGCLVSNAPERFQPFQPSWPVNVAAAAAGISAAGDPDFMEASLREVERLRRELFQKLDALPGFEVFPGAANFLLVRGPQGIPERLARRGVLVRGCAPFLGLGPEYFRVAVRVAEDTDRIVEALKEEI